MASGALIFFPQLKKIRHSRFPKEIRKFRRNDFCRLDEVEVSPKQQKLSGANKQNGLQQVSDHLQLSLSFQTLT
jgi:hypothetical protein